MSRADDLRAELALLEVEEQYRELKGSGAKRAKLKALELREARRKFREAREGATSVNPATIEAAAEVPEV